MTAMPAATRIFISPGMTLVFACLLFFVFVLFAVSISP